MPLLQQETEASASVYASSITAPIWNLLVFELKALRNSTARSEWYLDHVCLHKQAQAVWL
jgi:hypothetical protein